MKIIITGSLGHISKPLTQELVQKGHHVTVISSKTERIKDIEAIGAKAAIGSMEDVEFLTTTFSGADIVYAMETLGTGSVFNAGVDVIASITKIGENYFEAIKRSGVKKIIHLSSIGAHTDVGTGMLKFHHIVENILKQLPHDVSIKTMRPVGFYYNMLAFIPTIKNKGAIISNYGGDEKEPWVSTDDIALVIAEEMDKPFEGRSVRYIASEELSPNEVAKILGESIGKPDLQWTVISDEQLLNNMLTIGMSSQTAKGFVEMNAGRRNGALYEDYSKNRPALSNTKLSDYVKEFAKAYNK
jgi:uncharacterized protein YbjT (DUF2867 family)